MVATAEHGAAPETVRRVRGVAVTGQGLLLASLSLLAWAAATAVLLLRPDGRPTWHVIWAEDGRDFLTGAYEHPGPAGWFRPYAGYLHLLPRMIASGVALLAPTRAAEALAVAAAAVAAGCLLLVGHAVRRWMPGAWVPAVVVAALVLVNGLGREVAANLANLHWFLFLGSLGLILLRPRTAVAAVGAAVTALAFALSDALSFLLVPIAVVVAVAATRDRRQAAAARWLAWPVPAAVTAGAAAQLLTDWLAPRGTVTGTRDFGAGQLYSGYVREVLLLGIAPRVHTRLGSHAAVAALVVVLLGLTVFAWRTGGHSAAGRILLAATLVLLSCCLFVLSLEVNHGLTERYAALPAALVVLSVIVLLPGPGAVHRVALPGVCAVLVGLEVLSFRTSPPRGLGPDWIGSLRTAAAVQCVTPGSQLTVVIAPLRRPGDPRPPWTARVPCDRLPQALRAPAGG